MSRNTPSQILTPVNICVPICPRTLGLNFSVTCCDTQDSKAIKYLSYCALRTKKKNNNRKPYLNKLEHDPSKNAHTCFTEKLFTPTLNSKPRGVYQNWVLIQLRVFISVSSLGEVSSIHFNSQSCFYFILL